MSLEICNEVREHGVGISDLAVVQTTLVALRIRGRRLVRIVGIVEMYPNKMRARGMRIQPRLRALHYVHAPTFHPAPAGLGVGVLGKIVVKIKASIQARGKGFAVENHSANKCRGVITTLVEQFRPRWMR